MWWRVCYRHIWALCTGYGYDEQTDSTDSQEPQMGLMGTAVGLHITHTSAICCGNRNTPSWWAVVCAQEKWYHLWSDNRGFSSRCGLEPSSTWLSGETFQSCVLTVPVQNHFHSRVFIRGKHLVSETQNTNNRLFSCGGVAVGHAGGSPRNLESKVHVGPGPRLPQASLWSTQLILSWMLWLDLGAAVLTECQLSPPSRSVLRNNSQVAGSEIKHTLCLLFHEQEEPSVNKMCNI